MINTGMTKEEKKEYMRKYNATPQARQQQKRYLSTEKGKKTHLKGLKKHYYKIKGVYACFDGETNECLYVGGSKCVNARIINHKYAVNHLDKAKKHRPSHYEMYCNLATHASLVWSIIAECAEDKVRILEKQYREELNPKYNIYK